MTASAERQFHLGTTSSRRQGGPRVTLRRGPEPKSEQQKKPAQRIPRISKLMALAIHYQGLLDTGVVADASTLARLAGVTQPRMTQILNLNLLAPDIQEALLFLECENDDAAAISEKHLRGVAKEMGWRRQREIAAKLIAIYGVNT